MFPRIAPSALPAALLAIAVCGSARAEPLPTQPAAVCEAAGTAAEARHGIPAGLLNAIGRVESGRRDPATGRRAAWPWAINAEGRGRLFEDRAEALATTRALQAAGTASVDVGCFQVNLLHHRTAFGTLEDAFDPATNADYAARFLLALRDKVGTWETAVAHYHSATPERRIPYRDRVLATWSPGQPPLVPTPAAAPPGPVVIRMAAWTPQPGTPMRIWTPSPPGQAPSLIALR